VCFRFQSEHAALATHQGILVYFLRATHTSSVAKYLLFFLGTRITSVSLKRECKLSVC